MEYDMKERLVRARSAVQQHGWKQLFIRSYGHLTGFKLIENIYLSDDRIITRDNLQCVSNSIIPFDQSNVVELTPAVYTEECAHITRLVGKHIIHQPFIAEVSNVRLIGPEALAVMPDNRYILENSRGQIDALSDSIGRSILTLLQNKKQNEKLDSAVSLVGPYMAGSPNYYHWIVDYLSKIQGIKKYEEIRNEEMKILIPNNPPNWMRSSLELLDVWDQTVEWDKKSTTVEKLVIPTGTYTPIHLTDYQIVSPSRLLWLKNNMCKNIDLDDTYPKYVYISRNDADSRRIINENELIDSLPDHFESYELSKLSLIEQIRLFSEAEIIVGPHGAGLTNMIWGDNLHVLELWANNRKSGCFYSMAQSLGHKYSALECKSIKNDMIVNVDAVMDMISSILDK
ncbi:glycosyltransferase family 61 protein [Halorubrum ezzemoulense]|uniref:glycosyltransferase family 61 protein n=1 Tax=Halorubrum ezzemoulense TaxID=337243 RepID=UPI00232AFEA8|nr:glycosyltransferase family 61 protein [Halorubrum ezzemoulense]MDB2286711.1 glycosyltransferase family 61 protein [Halorubrum ezzemoulense]